MWSSDKKRVLDSALEKIDTPKGWLILTGVVVVMIYAHKSGMLNMWSSDKRDVLEKVINRVGSKSDGG